MVEWKCAGGVKVKSKLSESELKVLEILWNQGDLTAKQLSEILKDTVGWSKTTTYTVLKRSIEKKLIQRIEPNFLCHALITKQTTQAKETKRLLSHLYDGSPKELISFLVEDNQFSKEDIAELKSLIDKLDK